MTDQEFRRCALGVLMHELGPDGLARLLGLAKCGAGDYTRHRKQWLRNLTLDQILESIRKRRGSRSA